MELKKSVTIHPLFFILGLYFAFTGKVFSFLIYFLSALLHEFGHYVKAEKLGYTLVKLQIMPYGAVISGEMEGIKLKDEIPVLIAGPLVNLTIGLLCVCLWWLFPDLYPFTEEIATANFSLCVINLFPVYPLDGGRLLFSVLKKYLGDKRAKIICKTVSLTYVAVSLIFFALSAIKGVVNPSALFFVAFILLGVLTRGRDNKYVKIYSQFSRSSITGVSEIKVVAVGEKTTVKQLLARIDGTSLYQVNVLSENGRVIKTFSPYAVAKILSMSDVYTCITDCKV